MFGKNLFVSSLILCFVLLSVAARAQQNDLGKIDFPTSGSPPAQTHFLRGVAALHSFWYEEALEEFRNATKIQPDFMMGYWGEAMAHNRSFWRQQDTEAARKVLTNIKDSAKLSARERAYLNAVRLLYGEGDKPARDLAYSQAMEKIYRDYPEDLEAAAFYSLSLLSLSGKNVARRMKAGAIALDVFRQNPHHPGAAHYIIHAFDDPEHAILALPAAYRYAQIAPASAHAIHMPSHIFIQLGMWDKVVSSNEMAWKVSEDWVRNKKLSLRLRDYHSLYWLLYGYVQQGRYKKAEETIDVIKRTMNATSEKADDNLFHHQDDYARPIPYEGYYVRMAAALIVNSERWDEAKKLFEANPAKIKPTSQPPHSVRNGRHNAIKRMSESKPLNSTDAEEAEDEIFVRGLAAAKTNNAPEAKRYAEKLKSLKNSDDGVDSNTEFMELAVRAAAASAEGNHVEAVRLMEQAVAIEENMPPPSGPPELIKPSHELFGEILLKAGRFKEAAEAFAISLSRQPNRALSLLGAARTAEKLGDAKRAGEAYSAFLKIHAQADAGSSAISEAQDYLKQVSQK